MKKEISIIDQLASALDRRDETPNQELAKQIVLTNDKKAVLELIETLNNKNKNIQNDCIKVLYEVGEQSPSLIAKYLKDFLSLLDSKNNRLQWGAMTAISTITTESPQDVFNNITTIMNAADKGSVITKDNAVHILIKLCGLTKYADSSFTLLMELVLKSPTNQLPMYAEKTLPVINKKNKELFIQTLISRINEIEKETKRKRVEKVIKKVHTSI